MINGLDIGELKFGKNGSWNANLYLNGKKIGYTIDRKDGLGIYVRIPDVINEAKFELKWKKFAKTEAEFVEMLVIDAQLEQQKFINDANVQTPMIAVV